MASQQIPVKTDCTSNTITIEWQGQRGQFNNYIVKYRAKDSRDKFAVKQTSECKIHISNLKNDTLYEIKIFWEDNNGDESILIKTEVKTLASIASMLLKTAAKICDDPVIYRLTPVKVTNLTEGIQIREFFSDVKTRKERSLLLLGARGSGKSTLVDAIINYVTDVSFADDFRFKITDEITQGDEDIVCYKIKCQDSFKVEFNLNIIDVPGFESEDNESIYQKLLALFQSVRYVGAACLVVPSFCRLTEDDKCMFNNILSIFGKDFEFLIPLITFDDGGDIKALSSLEAANVPLMGHMQFRFNNSQLFSGNEKVEIWNRRHKTMSDLFGVPTIFIDWPIENTIEVLKNRIMLKQSADEAKCLVQIIKEKERTLKDDELRNRRPQHTRRTVQTNSHVRKICINCKMCKQTCVFDCSLSVRFLWYFFIVFEKFWSFVCFICSCCRGCSRCRCLCKLPYCCCIKCLHRCLGCTCSCSLAHHDKEYGRYRTNEKDTLKNVHDIEGQTNCGVKDTEDKLQIDKHKLNTIYDNMIKHTEFIKKTALLEKVPEEIERVVSCVMKKNNVQ